VLPKPFFSDLQQNKERDRRIKIRQLKGLFRTLLNSKISFNIKNYKVKKILLRSFISMEALVNSITITSSFALLPIDFKPSLR